jgi:hypothetical protein
VGPRAFVVEPKSPERRAEVAALLSNLGFQVVPDEKDDFAGLLSVSHPG